MTKRMIEENECQYHRRLRRKTKRFRSRKIKKRNQISLMLQAFMTKSKSMEQKECQYHQALEEKKRKIDRSGESRENN